jgi:hypothetical protein
MEVRGPAGFRAIRELLDFQVSACGRHLMSVQPNPSGRGIILALAALIIIWGLFGLADLKNVPYGGLQWGGMDDEVLRVEEGGPADQAGMKVGDKVISVDGVSVDDLGALRRLPREEIGDSRPFMVERINEATGESTTETLSVTFTAEPTSEVAAWFVAVAIGLAFLLCGILVYSKVPSPVTLLFCVVGLCFGALTLPAPYINAYGPRTLMEIIGTIFALTGFAALLHFLLVFPKRKQVLEKAGRVRLVYLPAAFLALTGILFSIIDGGSGGFMTALGYFSVALFIAYPVLSVVAIIHSFVTATPEERSEVGLNYVFWSATIGLIPIIILVLFGLFAPRISLPGGDYYFITMVLIPIGFALALLRSEKKPAAIL